MILNDLCNVSILKSLVPYQEKSNVSLWHLMSKYNVGAEGVMQMETFNFINLISLITAIIVARTKNPLWCDMFERGQPFITSSNISTSTILKSPIRSRYSLLSCKNKGVCVIRLFLSSGLCRERLIQNLPQPYVVFDCFWHQTLTVYLQSWRQNTGRFHYMKTVLTYVLIFIWLQ